jgi:hypothetical protein
MNFQYRGYDCSIVERLGNMCVKQICMTKDGSHRFGSAPASTSFEDVADGVREYIDGVL